jgi:hypothetical protein
MENGRLHDVPVTVIEPGEQYSGFGPLHVFNAYPQKNRALMEAGYRDAKRVMAARKRVEQQQSTRLAAEKARLTAESERAATATSSGKVVAIRPLEPAAGS